MIRSGDLYTALLQQSLQDSTTTTPFGISYNRYEVSQIFDVTNLASIRSYLLRCTHRFVIPSAVTGPSGIDSTAWTYLGYPISATATLNLTGVPTSSKSPQPWNVRLIDYRPRTLNAAVSTTAAQDQGLQTTDTHEHTTGQSLSQTNNFGLNGSVGSFGDSLTDSLGGDLGFSRTRDRFRSQSTGRSAAGSSGLSEASSMTVKDWAAFSDVHADFVDVTWTWAQEYPWDVIQFCLPTDSADNNYTPIYLPPWVTTRLFDLQAPTDKGDDPTPLFVYPPSHLALWGIDFTMTALWQIDLIDASADGSSFGVSHTVDLLCGSHGFAHPDTNGNTSTTAYGGAWLTPPATTTFNSPALDLTLLGLDPIEGDGDDDGAVVGFQDSTRFLVQPVNATGTPFKILADSNTVQVVGSGFNSDMSAEFSTANPTATFTVTFKVVDPATEFSLFLKHWNTSDAIGCQLAIVVNSTALTRHVDTTEGAGGDDNLMEINLRNKDYTSVNFHDYLVLGTNTIDVTISPDADGGGYVLRALAIAAP